MTEQERILNIRNTILFILIGLVGVSSSISGFASQGHDYATQLTVSSISAVNSVIPSNELMAATPVLESNTTASVSTVMSTFGWQGIAIIAGITVLMILAIYACSYMICMGCGYSAQC